MLVVVVVVVVRTHRDVDLSPVTSQLLDLLLDINENAKIPMHLRYDICSSSADVPDEAGSLEAAQRRLHEARNDLANGVISPEVFAQLEAHVTRQLSDAPIKTLTSLLRTPHTREPPDPLPDELDIGSEHPPGYLSPNHED